MPLLPGPWQFFLVESFLAFLLYWGEGSGRWKMPECLGRSWILTPAGLLERLAMNAGTFASISQVFLAVELPSGAHVLPEPIRCKFLLVLRL